LEHIINLLENSLNSDLLKFIKEIEDMGERMAKCAQVIIRQTAQV